MSIAVPRVVGCTDISSCTQLYLRFLVIGISRALHHRLLLLCRMLFSAIEVIAIVTSVILVVCVVPLILYLSQSDAVLDEVPLVALDG